MRSAAYSIAVCTAIAATAITLSTAGMIFIVSIPITWLIGELLMPRPEKDEA